MRHGKYNAQKTEYNGVMYDSKKEAAYAAELDVLLRTGEVVKIERQIKFQLIPKVSYILDFIVTYADGSKRYIDVKGYETAVFKIKKKLFEHFYAPLKIDVE